MHRGNAVIMNRVCLIPNRTPAQQRINHTQRESILTFCGSIASLGLDQPVFNSLYSTLKELQRDSTKPVWLVLTHASDGTYITEGSENSPHTLSSSPWARNMQFPLPEITMLASRTFLSIPNDLWPTTEKGATQTLLITAVPELKNSVGKDGGSPPQPEGHIPERCLRVIYRESKPKGEDPWIDIYYDSNGKATISNNVGTQPHSLVNDGYESLGNMLKEMLPPISEVIKA